MSAGISLGTIASVVGIAGGVKGLMSGSGGGNSSSGAQTQQAADPFSPYRDQLAGMYSGMLQPGAQTDITKMPGYSQFDSGVMQPALQSSQRAAASTGQLYSGAEQASLQQTAQKGYYGFMTDYMNRLAQGSGATNNPAQAAGMGVQQGNANQAGMMQGLGGIAQGVGGLQSQFGGNNQIYNPTTNTGGFAGTSLANTYYSGTGSVGD